MSGLRWLQAHGIARRVPKTAGLPSRGATPCTRLTNGHDAHTARLPLHRSVGHPSSYASERKRALHNEAHRGFARSPHHMNNRARATLLPTRTPHNTAGGQLFSVGGRHVRGFSSSSSPATSGSLENADFETEITSMLQSGRVSFTYITHALNHGYFPSPMVMRTLLKIVGERYNVPLCMPGQRSAFPQYSAVFEALVDGLADKHFFHQAASVAHWQRQLEVGYQRELLVRAREKTADEQNSSNSGGGRNKGSSATAVKAERERLAEATAELFRQASSSQLSESGVRRLVQACNGSHGQVPTLARLSLLERVKQRVRSQGGLGDSPWQTLSQAELQLVADVNPDMLLRDAGRQAALAHSRLERASFGDGDLGRAQRETAVLMEQVASLPALWSTYAVANHTDSASGPTTHRSLTQPNISQKRSADTTTVRDAVPGGGLSVLQFDPSSQWSRAVRQMHALMAHHDATEPPYLLSNTAFGRYLHAIVRMNGWREGEQGATVIDTSADAPTHTSLHECLLADLQQTQTLTASSSSSPAPSETHTPPSTPADSAVDRYLMQNAESLVASKPQLASWLAGWRTLRTQLSPPSPADSEAVVVPHVSLNRHEYPGLLAETVMGSWLRLNGLQDAYLRDATLFRGSPSTVPWSLSGDPGAFLPVLPLRCAAEQTQTPAVVQPTGGDAASSDAGVEGADAASSTKTVSKSSDTTPSSSSTDSAVLSDVATDSMVALNHATQLTMAVMEALCGPGIVTTSGSHGRTALTHAPASMWELLYHCVNVLGFHARVHARSIQESKMDASSLLQYHDLLHMHARLRSAVAQMDDSQAARASLARLSSHGQLISVLNAAICTDQPALTIAGYVRDYNTLAPPSDGWDLNRDSWTGVGGVVDSFAVNQAYETHVALEYGEPQQDAASAQESAAGRTTGVSPDQLQRMQDLRGLSSRHAPTEADKQYTHDATTTLVQGLIDSAQDQKAGVAATSSSAQPPNESKDGEQLQSFAAAQGEVRTHFRPARMDNLVLPTELREIGVPLLSRMLQDRYRQWAHLWQHRSLQHYQNFMNTPSDKITRLESGWGDKTHELKVESNDLPVNSLMKGLPGAQGCVLPVTPLLLIAASGRADVLPELIDVLDGYDPEYRKDILRSMMNVALDLGHFGVAEGALRWLLFNRQKNTYFSQEWIVSADEAKVFVDLLTNKGLFDRATHIAQLLSSIMKSSPPQSPMAHLYNQLYNTILNEMCRKLILQNRLEEAKKAFMQLSSHDREDSRTRALLVLGYARQGRIVDAMDMLTHVLKGTSGSSTLRLKVLGELGYWCSVQATSDMLNLFEMMLDADHTQLSHDHQAFLTKRVVSGAAQAGNYRCAFAYYDRVLRLAPEGDAGALLPLFIGLGMHMSTRDRKSDPVPEKNPLDTSSAETDGGEGLGASGDGVVGDRPFDLHAANRLSPEEQMEWFALLVRACANSKPYTVKHAFTTLLAGSHVRDERVAVLPLVYAVQLCLDLAQSPAGRGGGARDASSAVNHNTESAPSGRSGRTAEQKTDAKGAVHTGSTGSSTTNSAETSSSAEAQHTHSYSDVATRWHVSRTLAESYWNQLARQQMGNSSAGAHNRSPSWMDGPAEKHWAGNLRYSNSSLQPIGVKESFERPTIPPSFYLGFEVKSEQERMFPHETSDLPWWLLRVTDRLSHRYSIGDTYHDVQSSDPLLHLLGQELRVDTHNWGEDLGRVFGDQGIERGQQGGTVAGGVAAQLDQPTPGGMAMFDAGLLLRRYLRGMLHVPTGVFPSLKDVPSDSSYTPGSDHGQALIDALPFVGDHLPFFMQTSGGRDDLDNGMDCIKFLRSVTNVAGRLCFFDISKEYLSLLTPKGQYPRTPSAAPSTQRTTNTHGTVNLPINVRDSLADMISLSQQGALIALGNALVKPGYIYVPSLFLQKVTEGNVHRDAADLDGGLVESPETFVPSPPARSQVYLRSEDNARKDDGAGVEAPVLAEVEMEPGLNEDHVASAEEQLWKDMWFIRDKTDLSMYLGPPLLQRARSYQQMERQLNPQHWGISPFRKHAYQVRVGERKDGPGDGVTAVNEYGGAHPHTSLSPGDSTITTHSSPPPLAAEDAHSHMQAVLPPDAMYLGGNVPEALAVWREGLRIRGEQLSSAGARGDHKTRGGGQKARTDRVHSEVLPAAHASYNLFNWGVRNDVFSWLGTRVQGFPQPTDVPESSYVPYWQFGERKANPKYPVDRNLPLREHAPLVPGRATATEMYHRTTPGVLSLGGYLSSFPRSVWREIIHPAQREYLDKEFFIGGPGFAWPLLLRSHLRFSRPAGPAGYPAQSANVDPRLTASCVNDAGSVVGSDGGVGGGGLNGASLFHQTPADTLLAFHDLMVRSLFTPYNHTHYDNRMCHALLTMQLPGDPTLSASLTSNADISDSADHQLGETDRDTVLPTDTQQLTARELMGVFAPVPPQQRPDATQHSALDALCCAGPAPGAATDNPYAASFEPMLDGLEYVRFPNGVRAGRREPPSPDLPKTAVEAVPDYLRVIFNGMVMKSLRRWRPDLLSVGFVRAMGFQPEMHDTSASGDSVEDGSVAMTEEQSLRHVVNTLLPALRMADCLGFPEEFADNAEQSRQSNRPAGRRGKQHHQTDSRRHHRRSQQQQQQHQQQQQQQKQRRRPPSDSLASYDELTASNVEMGSFLAANGFVRHSRFVGDASASPWSRDVGDTSAVDGAVGDVKNTSGQCGDSGHSAQVSSSERTTAGGQMGSGRCGGLGNDVPPPLITPSILHEMTSTGNTPVVFSHQPHQVSIVPFIRYVLQRLMDCYLECTHSRQFERAEHLLHLTEEFILFFRGCPSLARVLCSDAVPLAEVIQSRPMHADVARVTAGQTPLARVSSKEGSRHSIPLCDIYPTRFTHEHMLNLLTAATHFPVTQTDYEHFASAHLKRIGVNLGSSAASETEQTDSTAAQTALHDIIGAPKHVTSDELQYCAPSLDLFGVQFALSKYQVSQSEFDDHHSRSSHRSRKYGGKPGRSKNSGGGGFQDAFVGPPVRSKHPGSSQADHSNDMLSPHPAAHGLAPAPPYVMSPFFDSFPFRSMVRAMLVDRYRYYINHSPLSADHRRVATAWLSYQAPWLTARDVVGYNIRSSALDVTDFLQALVHRQYLIAEQYPLLAGCGLSCWANVDPANLVSSHVVSLRRRGVALDLGRLSADCVAVEKALAAVNRVHQEKCQAIVQRCLQLGTEGGSLHHSVLAVDNPDSIDGTPCINTVDDHAEPGSHPDTTADPSLNPRHWRGMRVVPHMQSSALTPSQNPHRRWVHLWDSVIREMSVQNALQLGDVCSGLDMCTSIVKRMMARAKARHRPANPFDIIATELSAVGDGPKDSHSNHQQDSKTAGNDGQSGGAAGSAWDSATTPAIAPLSLQDCVDVIVGSVDHVGSDRTGVKIFSDDVFDDRYFIRNRKDRHDKGPVVVTDDMLPCALSCREVVNLLQHLIHQRGSLGPALHLVELLCASALIGVPRTRPVNPVPSLRNRKKIKLRGAADGKRQGRGGARRQRGKTDRRRDARRENSATTARDQPSDAAVPSGEAVHSRVPCYGGEERGLHVELMDHYAGGRYVKERTLYTRRHGHGEVSVPDLRHTALSLLSSVLFCLATPAPFPPKNPRQTQGGSPPAPDVQSSVESLLSALTRFNAQRLLCVQQSQLGSDQPNPSTLEEEMEALKESYARPTLVPEVLGYKATLSTHRQDEDEGGWCRWDIDSPVERKETKNARQKHAAVSPEEIAHTMNCIARHVLTGCGLAGSADGWGLPFEQSKLFVTWFLQAYDKWDYLQRDAKMRAMVQESDEFAPFRQVYQACAELRDQSAGRSGEENAYHPRASLDNVRYGAGQATFKIPRGWKRGGSKHSKQTQGRHPRRFRD